MVVLWGFFFFKQQQQQQQQQQQLIYLFIWLHQVLVADVGPSFLTRD